MLSIWVWGNILGFEQSEFKICNYWYRLNFTSTMKIMMSWKISLFVYLFFFCALVIFQNHELIMENHLFDTWATWLETPRLNISLWSRSQCLNSWLLGCISCNSFHNSMIKTTWPLNFSSVNAPSLQMWMIQPTS